MIYQIAPYVRDFLAVKFFFIKLYFKTLASSYRKRYREAMK